MAQSPARPGPGVRHGSGGQALQIITAPAAKGDGWRHLWLGDTGTGKTWAERRLLTAPGGLTLIHDDSKSQPEYPGVPYVLAIEAAPPGATVVGFRGDPWAGTKVEVEEVAALALRVARVRRRVRLVVDELNRAVSEAGRKLESDSLREGYTAGRSMGMSIEVLTQTPQRVPQVILDQSSSVGIFRLGPRALNYLDDVCLFDPDMLALVPTLQEGQFVIHRPGCSWDRTVYKF